MDKGWVELTDSEQKALRESEVMARIQAEKVAVSEALSNPNITVADKIAWLDYSRELDVVCLCPDFDCDPKFPIRPSV